MKTKVISKKFTPGVGRTTKLFSRIACLGSAILICTSASAQNLFVSGNDAAGGEIYKFTWDGGQSIFASGLIKPWDLAVDSRGNVFVVAYVVANGGEVAVEAAIYKITPTGARTTFASGLGYPSYLAVDSAGNVFVADYNQGVVYEYNPTGSRAIFASGLYHPVGMAFDSSGNLFVADNNAGNLHQGSIYKYAPNGSRVTFAVLERSDQPADLAFDSMGNLYMADLRGNIYKYDLGILRRYPRTTFGSVPNSAQSLVWDSSGNLLVVNADGANDNSNAVYKFSTQGVRSMFASGQTLGESFVCLAFQPLACCQ